MIKREGLSARIYQLCCRVKEQRPLVHVVTNFVIMNETANALLAIGASPTMSWAGEDAEYLSRISDSLCINIGTPVKERIDVMESLMSFAQEAGKPVVLDPVGAGAGDYRTGIAKKLFSIAPHKIIRGNASEVCSLVDQNHTTRGIENNVGREEAKKILMGHGRANGETDPMVDPQSGLADILEFADCLIVSGKKDMIFDKNGRITLENGDSLMNSVTGTGCILSAMTAAFYAVSSDGCEAAVAACSMAGIAGELAAKKAGGPGTFMAHFLDALYNMDEKTLKARLKVTSYLPGMKI
ncbi:MAG: hydroxyethylthiazole kinase [Desulfobacterium sp.]|jgi:hydroxyethylthiazole kinase|nr:hydroxyethylthiazole kinase [Desulfobacterium sp.]